MKPTTLPRGPRQDLHAFIVPGAVLESAAGDVIYIESVGPGGGIVRFTLVDRRGVGHRFSSGSLAAFVRLAKDAGLAYVGYSP